MGYTDPAGAVCLRGVAVQALVMVARGLSRAAVSELPRTHFATAARIRHQAGARRATERPDWTLAWV